MSDELIRCPFCGHQSAVIAVRPYSGGLLTYPLCEYCGAQCETVELWKSRPIEDELRRELYEAKTEIGRLKAKIDVYVDEMVKARQLLIGAKEEIALLRAQTPHQFCPECGEETEQELVGYICNCHKCGMDYDSIIPPKQESGQ